MSRYEYFYKYRRGSVFGYLAFWRAVVLSVTKLIISAVHSIEEFRVHFRFYFFFVFFFLSQWVFYSGFS